MNGQHSKWPFTQHYAVLIKILPGGHFYNFSSPSAPEKVLSRLPLIFKMLSMILYYKRAKFHAFIMKCTISP